jgi:hypothetical protein
MSHIPEDELHAYLDQALGRPRCVEIESHLAECTRCRDARDGIAALRDRTTALLARLAPRRGAMPPYAEIRRRAQLRLFRQQRVLARLAWAASVVLALGIGWTASSLYRTPAPQAPFAAAPEQPAPISVAQPEPPPPAAVPAPAPPQPVRATAPAGSAPERRLAVVPARSRSAVPPPAPPDAWRTVAWDAAPPPPLEARVAAAEPPAPPPPSSGVVVTRQLASGEVVRAAGGSTTDVSSLLSGRPSPGSGVKPAPPAMPPAYSSAALALRQGSVAAGPSAVPSDSLRAMMRRLNLMLRVR